jgi:Ca-activated chloride channel family protein
MKTNKTLLVLLIFLLSVTSVYSITVKGIVTDNSNNPVIGASVYIKGTTRGTVTDLSGKYSMEAYIGDTLVFSYIGFNSVEVKVSKEEINVVMEESKNMLDEVIVVAFGTQKKESVVGSVNAAHSYDDMSAEEYSNAKENRFFNPIDDPLSTFSVDVDAASYGTMRRMLNQGNKPPSEAIRIEELINYFSYDLPGPTGNDPVKITVETGECPWNTNHRLMRIGLKAKEIDSEYLPASNLVFLIDVSGSMYGATRLDLVKASLKLLVNNLRDKDKVSIVVYAGAAGEVLPATSGGDKQKIKDVLEQLTSGGSTAGGEGIRLAYDIAKKNFIEEGNNRVILCTDGDFNVGVSSVSGLETLIENEREKGVYLTVLGYGMGNYKDDKMQTLAQKGNGNHAYIDNLQEANKVLVNEFGGTLFTVAKDVKLQVEFNPGKVQAYRLVGYETRLLNKEDFNDDTKDAGEMGVGHTVTAYYEIVPTGIESNITGSVDKLKYQSDKPKTKTDNPSAETATVKLRYKNPDGYASKKIEVAVTDNKNKTSDDFRFGASVAMFGQLLKNSEFKGDATYDKVLSLAGKSTGEDNQGYRKEFIRLVELAKGLD